MEQIVGDGLRGMFPEYEVRFEFIQDVARRGNVSITHYPIVEPESDTAELLQITITFADLRALGNLSAGLTTKLLPYRMLAEGLDARDRTFVLSWNGEKFRADMRGRLSAVVRDAFGGVFTRSPVMQKKPVAAAPPLFEPGPGPTTLSAVTLESIRERFLSFDNRPELKDGKKLRNFITNITRNERTSSEVDYICRWLIQSGGATPIEL